MHHFTYRNGELFAEDVPVSEIAEAVGTPFYCYSDATLTRHYSVLAEALKNLPSQIFYSVKANSNLAVVATLARLGAGADVVSEGEIRRAIAAGIPPQKIVFSGVGKTAREIEYALTVGIHQFNVESEPELELLSALAASKGKKARVGIRVNPDVDAKTHAKITTGKLENKFGISWRRVPDVYAYADSLPGIQVTSLDVHIGSQITDLAPFEAAFNRVAEMVETLRAQGHHIENIDLGGGLGVPYRGDNDIPPHPEEYARMVERSLGHLGADLYFEPGRMLAANAGILVSSVVYEKHGDERSFLILDGAMNDLIRPTLYDAYHEIKPVAEQAPEAKQTVYDVVGPVCETGDYFAKGRALPSLKAGDLVAVMSAGAYGAVQASTYNTRPLAPEVMVKGSSFSIIRPRLSYDEMLAHDRFPEWLED